MKMTIEDLRKVIKNLESRGYRKNFEEGDLFKPNQSGYFNYYYKVIDRGVDKYGDSRAINQLLFRVWSLYEFRDRIKSDSLYSLEPVISFSREIDERIDISLQYPERDIDELEKIAKDLGEWIKENIKLVEK